MFLVTVIPASASLRPDGAAVQTLTSRGIEVDQFSSHIFRRTAATIVESVAGIIYCLSVARPRQRGDNMCQLVVVAEQGDPATATILEGSCA